MTDVVKNDNITSIVSAIETLVRDSSDKITETATKYGPQVLDTAESYIRVLALIDIVKSVVELIGLIVLFYVVLKYTAKFFKIGSDEDENYFFLVIIGCIVLFCISWGIIHLFVYTFTTDNILSVISPKLELIKMSKDALTTHLVGK